jgi:hypothetical protein
VTAYNGYCKQKLITYMTTEMSLASPFNGYSTFT